MCKLQLITSFGRLTIIYSTEKYRVLIKRLVAAYTLVVNVVNNEYNVLGKNYRHVFCKREGPSYLI